MRDTVILKKAYHYTEISVLIPTQVGQKWDLVPVELPIPENISSQQGEFTLIRPIINLEFFMENDREEPVISFNPPIEFRIGYRFDDVKMANCDIQQLKLVYWDGEKWVIISDTAHEYQILPPSTAQVAEVKIWSWLGDPPLAWGK